MNHNFLLPIETAPKSPEDGSGQAEAPRVASNAEKAAYLALYHFEYALAMIEDEPENIQEENDNE